MIPTTELPAKELTDALIDIYLRTIEKVYRIVHIPSFMRDYDALWISGTQPELAFVIQLKLMCAIGATMYDDEFSLRVSAIQWVHEAQTWISEPERKARLNIQFLQMNILHLFAREIVGVDGRLIWISTGELLRTAISMGLHRDPIHLPKRNHFIAEMRRRLWNTILEMNVQTSLESGEPPLLSSDDFDTHPPGNFDDEQILFDNPIPKPDGTYTQTSIALLLRTSFTLRLTITKSLNGIGTHMPYDEVLRMDRSFRTLCKGILQTIRAYGTDKTNSAPSSFEIRVVDYLIRRNLLALHTPYFGLGFEIDHAFSRKVVVESALAIWSSVYPTSSIGSAAPHHSGYPPTEQMEFIRLVQCGSGPFRTTAIQACFLIAAELKIQLQEEYSLGPAVLRQDLLSVLEECKQWFLDCIRRGDVNTKGCLFISLVTALIEGLRQGYPEDQLPEFLIQAADESELQCLKILEESLGHNRDEIQMALDRIDDTPVDSMPDLVGYYDFMVGPTL